MFLPKNFGGTKEERIYSPENPKDFFGNPVHYKMTANNSVGAKTIVVRFLAEILSKESVLRSGEFIDFIDYS